jgi:hypothetical protein
MTIKQSLITSPYNIYPTLQNIKNIKCELNVDSSSNFIIRIYTRPIFTSINNDLNTNDKFYGNYYDSILFDTNSDYRTYHLNELFPSWRRTMNTSYKQRVYYFNGFQNLETVGEQQILSICILTYGINANIGIKNIILTYK